MRASPHTLMIPTPWVYGIGFAFRDTQIPICLGAALELGRPTFLVLRNAESCLTATQLSFVLIPEVYPKTVVWKGNGNRR